MRTVRLRIPLFDDSERLSQSRLPHILQKLFPVNPAIDDLPLVVRKVDLARPSSLLKAAERGRIRVFFRIGLPAEPSSRKTAA